jgi:hypothetical protein
VPELWTLGSKEFTMRLQPFKYKSFALIAFLALNNFAFGGDVMSAISRHDLEGVKALIKDNPVDGITTNTSMGMTPLGWAADKGYKDIVELLLANGADVNGHGNDVTPLMLAQRMDHEDVEEVLLQHGGHGTIWTTKPFVGWYADGDIRFHLVKDVTDDYQEYIAKNKLAMPDQFDIYYDNQTGKYAVTFQAFLLDQNASQRYALIYDKNNKRIKVIKYDYARYQC